MENHIVSSAMKNDQNGHLEALEYLCSLKKSEYTMYEKLRLQIFEKKKEIEHHLENYVIILLKQLTASWMKFNDNIIKQENKILQEKLPGSFHKEHVILPTENILRFFPGTVSEKTLFEMFGKLDMHLETDIQIEQLKSVNTKQSYINPLLPINDRCVYGGSAVNKSFGTYNISRELEENCQCKLEVCSVASFKNGELLISSSNESVLKKIEVDGSIQPFHDFNPLIPKGVCIRDDNEIIIGLREATEKPFRIEKDSERQVRRLDSYGRTRHIYELDERHNRLFTLPCRITAKKDDIFVLDMQNDNRGRVVSMSLSGDLLWIYNGYQYSQHSFCPNDITVSTGSLLIIPDLFNNALHFLNTKGDIVLYKTLNTLGIKLPCSVAMDYKNQLWVGTIKDKNINAKIHILSLWK